MPKKKNKKKSNSKTSSTNSSEDEDQFYDSDGTTTSRADDIEYEGEAVGGRLSELLELLSEKRYTIRENALSDLIKLLCLGCRQEECETVKETLGMYLCNSIRRGKKKESTLGSRALSIVAITIGMDQDSLVETVAPVLVIMATKGKDETARSEAILALAIVCFVCSTNEEQSNAAIVVFSSIISQASKDLVAGKTSKKTKAKPLVVAAACRGWALLGSVANLKFFQGGVFDDMLHKFHILLGHGILDVKVAAGECIALLFDMLGMKLSDSTGNGDGDNAEEVSEEVSENGEGGFLGAAVANEKKEKQADEQADEQDEDEDDEEEEEEEEEDDDDDDDDDEEEEDNDAKSPLSRGRSGSKSGRGTDYDQDETLTETLTRLAHEYNRKKNRKERKEQKVIFRDMCSTVIDGDALETKLKIDGEELFFNTWSERVQIDALRSSLSSGFQIHVRDNQVVRQIFNLGRTSGGKAKSSMSNAEKRMYKSKNSVVSKERTKNMIKERNKRRNVKNDFLNGE